MAGLSRNTYQRIPSPGGATAQDQASVYDTFYGQMPIPATQYATTDTPLMSVDIQPSIVPIWKSAHVQRRNMKQGMASTGGYQQRRELTQRPLMPVESSAFQQYLIGPQVNFSMNTGWYIDYPAATVMLGGQHNLALSQRIPQIPTRTTGGPGPGSMRQAPRFKAVQTIPRYSTMPPTYPTASTNG